MVAADVRPVTQANKIAAILTVTFTPPPKYA
jgi:hypothetical protein